MYWKVGSINFSISAVFWVFIVSSATAETFSTLTTSVNTGRFLWLRGQVIESVQSGDNFWLRVNVTPGDYGIWKDTIIVTYRAVVEFQGRHRGKTSYKTRSWRDAGIAARRCLPTA